VPKPSVNDSARSAATAPAEAGGRAARWALIVLTLINLFNYLDRYVPAALVESLRRSSLHVTDTESGFLMSGFIVVYMLTSPLFGALGERRRSLALIGERGQYQTIDAFRRDHGIHSGTQGA